MYYDDELYFVPPSPEEKAEYLRRQKEKEEEEELLRQQQMEARRKQREAEQLIYQRYFCNPVLFLETEGLFRYDPDGSITSQDLYRIYRNWCIREHRDNQLPCLGVCVSYACPTAC